MMNYLQNVNEKQKEVITNTEGPILVLAGAGTGKTKVLTSRFAYIIDEKKISPYSILAVTFTNKAAKEMYERIQKFTNIDSTYLWIGTFHGICLRIIKNHIDLLPINKNFSIIDRNDQKKILKPILETLNIDTKLTNYILEKIDYYKNQANIPENEYVFNKISAKQILESYQKSLTELNLCDFNDLIIHCINIWKNNPEVLASYQEKFQYIMVDEYQDTNPIQYEWIKLLCIKSCNICCVGDEDQSIYSWRGADISNILNFEKDFPGAKIVLLEENYRSTQAILETANYIISKNTERKSKKLFSNKQSNELIEIVNLFNEKEEATFITNQINRLANNGHNLSDIAILVRTNSQMGPLEEKLFQSRIPYQIIGGTKFYDRKETKDLLAYLHLINDQNSTFYLERIINVPRRGIGNATIRKIQTFASENNLSMFASIKIMIQNQLLSGKISKQLQELTDNIQFYSQNHGPKLSELLDYILCFTKYTDLELDVNDKKTERMENINELRNIIDCYSDLNEFLNNTALMTDLDQENTGNCIKLMTIHAAKGLEFETTFLAGWEDGILPYKKSEEENNIEEERRLSYVAITRAKSKCFISFCRKRRVFNQIIESSASRFLLNLNVDYIKFHRS